MDDDTKFWISVTLTVIGLILQALGLREKTKPKKPRKRHSRRKHKR